MIRNITIGIPAYNEGQNIAQLLLSLSMQKFALLKIEKIIVCSDGSTDNTREQVLSVKNKKIVFIDNKDRRGQSARQNQIITSCHSDILVLLNADILIKKDDFIQQLIQPIVDGSADLTSSRVKTLPPKSFLGKIFCASYVVRNGLYDNYKAGNNIYTCHGAARAFSKRMYSKFRFKKSVAEDAFSYLYAIHNNLKYVYSPKAIAHIRWPENLKDHLSQSSRFFQSKKVLLEDFSRTLLDQEYYLPKTRIVASALQLFWKNPLYGIVYSFIYSYTYFISLINRVDKPKDTWVIALSSKDLA